MPKLGKTQKAVYEFICIYIEENFIPPTVREIGAAVGLKSTSTVHMHLPKPCGKRPHHPNPFQATFHYAPQKRCTCFCNVRHEHTACGQCSSRTADSCGRKHPGLFFRPRVIFAWP